MNRVTEVLHRMDDNSSQPDAMKTCFGILAIMSREDVNKVLIARDGMETILNVMTQHVDKADIQESGCDLIWSLAFNNSAVKDTIARHGGASVLVRAMKRHNKSPEFLKSACGALSNMCQSRLNQEGIASQGGLQPLVASIHVHQNNSKLLPFIFDALASLIVSNEENARTVSSLGMIPLIVSSLARHKAGMEVVKSGCHALAILSDVKGQASKIAFAGGVAIILSLLDVHPAYADLHRVAAVVILRMLQESTHVGREITCNEGVRIFLKSLEKGGAQQDTVAAVTHILFTVTNPSSPSSSNIENQLWLNPAKEEEEQRASKKGAKKADEVAVGGRKAETGSGGVQVTALGGLVHILGHYCDRRDVVRAACRLLNNLGGFPGVIMALEKLNVLDRVLTCVHNHGETRDVVDSTAAMLKAIHRRAVPLISATPACMAGLLHVINNKINDDDVILAGTECISKFVESNIKTTPALFDFDTKRHAEGASSSSIWELETLSLFVKIMDRISGAPEERSPTNSTGSAVSRDSPTVIKMMTSRRAGYTKNTPRILTAILTLIDTYFASKYINFDSEVCNKVIRALQNILESMTTASSDLGKRIEKLILLGKKQQSGADDVLQSDNSETEEGAKSSASHNTASNSTARRGQKAQEKKSSAGGAANVELMAYPTYISSSGCAIPKVWRTENGADGVSEDPLKLFPLHPNNYFKSLRGVQEHEVPRLLDTWPTYLERLVVNHSMSSSSFGGMGSNGQNERMHVVFEGGSAAGKGLMSRCTTPVPYNVPINGIGAPFEHSLTFDSEFESGNLLRVVQKGDANYDLFLRSDLHTGGHTQWFYFAVSNTHPAPLVKLAEQGVQVPPVRARFNIVNLTKPDSLFNLGMRPVLYSCLDAATKNIGWVRGGSEISYYSNSYGRTSMAGEGVASYYTLSFTLEFQHAKDSVLVAYSYPYTYSDYRAHISRLLSKPGSQDVVRSQRLCQTLSGEECDLLVITDYKGKDRDRIGPINLPSAESYRADEAQRRVGGTMGRSGKAPAVDNTKVTLKPAFFLSCRVHPGETPASWMMKGVLDFLTSDCTQAKLLRQVYVIFIVPMLNPDGVIFGNNRCSLSGVDLNRQWKTPIKGLHPTVYTLKALMQAQRRLREVSMYIDLHGHSRKYNVFLYGCDEKKKPKPQVRAFPRFFSMHHVGKKYVCFADCSFHVRKGRESTARVVVAREMNIPCSFTLEATFCGSNYGPLKHCHMHVGHLQETGAAMCDAILNFSISEGKVADAMMVPANVRLCAQIETAIGDEDGVNYNGMAHSIMSENSATFTNANSANQAPTGFHIIPGTHVVTGVTSANSASTVSSTAAATALNTASSGSSSGFAELRHKEVALSRELNLTEEKDSMNLAKSAAGVGASSRRNSAGGESDQNGYAHATVNAADLDSDSDGGDGDCGGDSDLDSLVGASSAQLTDSGDADSKLSMPKRSSNPSFDSQSSSSGTGYAELRNRPGSTCSDVAAEKAAEMKRRMIGVQANSTMMSSTMPNFGSKGMTATLSLEATTNGNGLFVPQPPRDGNGNNSGNSHSNGNANNSYRIQSSSSHSPAEGFISSSSVNGNVIGAGGTTDKNTSSKKNTAKDDTALTRSGHRVLDGMTSMTTIGASASTTQGRDGAPTKSEKGGGNSKKKANKLVLTSSAKSNRSRSKDQNGDSKEAASSGDDRDGSTLPRL